MDGHLVDWANLRLRWLHVIVAIAWIGSSFYFVWLDNSLRPPADKAMQQKGVGGELWAVHGGGFYNPQKYIGAPPQLPDELHWFYWESYSTWISGFGLFSVLYLFNPKVFLIDSTVANLTPMVAVIAALSFLVVGWLVYDALCRVLQKQEKLLTVLVVLYVVAAAYTACHLFAGRAAFLIIGAMIATIMSANVFLVIIPGQRKATALMKLGQPVDPIYGQRGKQRSVHNTYFTLPVLFAMLSNHYSMTYSHKYNWLILVMIMVAGVLIRQFFILRHKGKLNLAYPALAVAVLVAVIGWTGVSAIPVDEAHAAASSTGPAAPIKTESTVSASNPAANGNAPNSSPAEPSQSVAKGQADIDKVQKIVAERCVQCHAAKPTMMPTPAKGIVLEGPNSIRTHAQLIYQQVVVQKVMPLGNMTKITDGERTTIAKWFEAGAK